MVTETHPRRRLLTVAEYHRMAEAGIFGPDERVELLEGEIVEVAAMGSRHLSCIGRLTTLFKPVTGEQAVLLVRCPVVATDNSEPEPDLMLLRLRPDYYAAAKPAGKDVLLVIEISDTSLAHDGNTKLPIYAAAQIPEAWLVALPRERIEVHSRPIDGEYREIRLYARGDTLTPLAFPDLHLRVDDVLGPPAAG